VSACSKCYIFSTWECRGLGTIWAAGVWRQRGVERAIVVVVRRKQRRRLKPKKRVKYGETRGLGGSKTNQSRLTQWVTSGHCRWCQKRMHLPTTSPGLRRRLARSEECPSQVTSHKSHVTRHTSHVTHHTSHVTRHTSHVTRHTSHITRHASHVTRHASAYIHHGVVGPQHLLSPPLEPCCRCNCSLRQRSVHRKRVGIHAKRLCIDSIWDGRRWYTLSNCLQPRVKMQALHTERWCELVNATGTWRVSTDKQITACGCN
jgi:hypothetical protein